MKLGPKYKIARRVGAPIFEKTQTQKYSLRAERKAKTARFGKPKSEYGTQLNEKQKARFTYGLSEKQFSNYVKEALQKKSTHPTNTIFENLELRADNAVYRLGLAPTRSAARQTVSHGHIAINGKKITIPSQRLKIGDTISIREGSLGKGLWSKIDDSKTTPAWLSFDRQKKLAKVSGLPQLVPTENMFDLSAVVEFYSR
jgi:small subunit ribosomal protein S4